MAASSSAEFSLHITIFASLSSWRTDAEVLSLSGLRSSDTIRYLKSQIFWKGGILQEDQHIITYKGELLEDGKTLADYNLNAKMNNLILLKTYENYLSFVEGLATEPYFGDDFLFWRDDEDDDEDDEDDDDDDVECSPPLKKRKHYDDDDDVDDVCGSATPSSSEAEDVD